MQTKKFLAVFALISLATALAFALSFLFKNADRNKDELVVPPPHKSLPSTITADPTVATESEKQSVQITPNEQVEHGAIAEQDCKIENSCDTDGDGILDSNEIAVGTNPFNPCSPDAFNPSCDTDEDGISDGEEKQTGSDIYDRCDPIDPDGTCDRDFDGLTDQKEMALDSDPLDPCDPEVDSEVCRDFLNDAVNNGANESRDQDQLPAFVDHSDSASRTPFGNGESCPPNERCDSDGDGISDNEEKLAGTNPKDSCSPDNTNSACDRDMDGISDGLEISGDSDLEDPCDPDTSSFACSLIDKLQSKFPYSELR